MLLEVAKPVALGLCLLSLLAVFHAAFLVPATGFEQRIWDSVMLLSLAAGICLSSGLIFRESERRGATLASTLPVQLFCWGAGLMLVLFVASWYLETYCIFYRDMRRF
jgi:hypothetical protein